MTGRLERFIVTAKADRDGRFLGGFDHEPTPGIRYVDTNRGDWTSFDGVEWIELEGARVYELLYHGGSIRES